MTVRELIDNVTRFEMGSFGYLGERTVIFEKKGEERTVHCEGLAFIYKEYEFKPRTLSKEEWDEFFYKIFGECNVMKYPKEFVNTEFVILDGETWNMHIEFANRRAKNSGGYNAYPENWKELADILAKYDSFYEYDTEEEDEE